MSLALRNTVVSSHQLPRNDDILMSRMELLSQSDRLIMDAIFMKNQTTTNLAILMGTTGRVIRHRVHLLSRRIKSRQFLDTARALAYLSQSDATLARMRFCEGLGYRELAKALGITTHQVRRRLDLIRGQIMHISRQRRQHTLT